MSSLEVSVSFLPLNVARLATVRKKWSNRRHARLATVKTPVLTPTLRDLACLPPLHHNSHKPVRTRRRSLPRISRRQIHPMDQSAAPPPTKDFRHQVLDILRLFPNHWRNWCGLFQKLQKDSEDSVGASLQMLPCLVPSRFRSSHSTRSYAPGKCPVEMMTVRVP